jgi:hypothetical protein
MQQPTYTYYYDLPQTDYYYLNNQQLLQDISDQLYIYESSKNEMSCEKKDSILNTIDNIELWSIVSLLQWKMRSDSIISNKQISTIISNLDTDGNLGQVKKAINILSKSILSTYPHIDLDRPSLIQLIALGKELAIASCQSNDLLEFVKKEFQIVNLVELLNV